MSKINVVLGSDPEFMVVNNEGIIVPSCDLLPGTKEEPYDLGNGCSIQVDNVMAELTVPPTSIPEEMYNNIQNGIEATISMLPQGYSLINKSSHIFTDEQLAHPTAKVFGCEPDYNPYGTTLRNPGRVVQNPPPKANNPNLRTAGGHIHICITDFKELFNYSGGFASYKPEINCLPLVLDYCLGLPSLFLDSDTQRRELYGKPGAFRYKPYGIEYRTLSNFWVNNLSYIELIYKTINHLANTNLGNGFAMVLSNPLMNYKEKFERYLPKELLYNKFLELGGPSVVLDSYKPNISEILNYTLITSNLEVAKILLNISDIAPGYAAYTPKIFFEESLI